MGGGANLIRIIHPHGRLRPAVKSLGFYIKEYWKICQIQDSIFKLQ